MRKEKRTVKCIELFAGAGGLALGIEKAGFETIGLIEFNRPAAETLKKNRPEWNVICADVHHFDGKKYKGVDLFAGGVPCPPFSKAS